MKQQEKQELFDKITNHLLTDKAPSKFITEISNQKDYQCYPFFMLWKLKETEQSPKHHPEGSVWNHTMMVLDEAALVKSKSTDVNAFMWAALLHDIGKPTTTRTRNGKTTSYDHDIAGERLSKEFLDCFSVDQELIEKISSLVRYHMHMLYVQKKLPFGDVKNMLQKVDIEDIALLCRCDRLGRLGSDRQKEEEEYIRFLNELKDTFIVQTNIR